ncbi:MAG TPA: DUF885 domain-containing protein [Thermoanaerobaculia bacterium]|nr:DUF885 domain-containing protein [Thermoanaerobaculia bacterium]
MNKFSIAFALLLIAGCAAVPDPVSVAPAPATAELQQPVAPPISMNQRFDELAERYFEATLVLSPLTAASIGDYRYNDQFPVSISEEHRAATKAMKQRYLNELAMIDDGALDDQRRLSHAMLVADLRRDLEQLEFPGHLIPVNQFYNTAALFAQLGSGSSLHPFRTAKDYDDFLGRVDGFERWVDTAIANMRRGMASGIVQPRILIERTIPQLDALIADDVEKSLFYRPLQDFPEAVSQSDRKRLTSTYRSTIANRLNPAYRKLRDFLKNEYLPKSRSTVGMAHLPNGRSWYETLVRSTTTTDLTPEEIHQIGLSEVARIHGEMKAVIAETGFKGDLHAFFQFLQTDPSFYFTEREDLIQGYRDLKVRIDALTPRLFDVAPKADYEVRAVEPFRERSASGGSYSAATPDGSRPGVFYVNAYDLKARPKYAMEALSLHEGAPGHHFQISVQRELEDLPRFRRFGGYTAYSEGWGLYAESIGKELGVYTDPYQHFGGLDAELWRAIRLVVDTGIHAKGWTREQAIQYARENSSVGETRATAEVERFIAIPSQALAYKIGQLEITRLRRKAEAELGPRFDIKAFHRAILSDGALPLEVLAEKIDRWIEARRG